jgi:hypothetical protein
MTAREAISVLLILFVFGISSLLVAVSTVVIAVLLTFYHAPGDYVLWGQVAIFSGTFAIIGTFLLGLGILTWKRRRTLKQAKSPQS